MTAPVVADRVHVRAPGKLNLFFEVGDVQADGYHDVASAYQAVSLYEDVWAEPAADFSVSVSGTVDVVGGPARTTATSRCARRGCSRSRSGYAGGVHLDIRQARPGGGRHGRRIGGCRGRPRRVRRAVGHRPRRRRAAPARGAARRRRAVRADGRHGDRHRPRRSAEPGTREGPLRLGRRARRRAGLSTPEVYAHLDALRARRHPRHRRGAARPEVDPGVLQALRAGRPGRPRRARAQRPAGGRAVAAARSCATRSSSASRPGRSSAWSRARVRRSRSSPATPNRRSSCR